jgi:hypothetical protein
MRKEMGHYLSTGFLRHMNLMKKSITSSYEERIEGLEGELSLSRVTINSLKERIQVLESQVMRQNKQGKSKIVVDRAGIDQVNGEYIWSGFKEGNPFYKKLGHWDNAPAMFGLIQTPLPPYGRYCWAIFVKTPNYNHVLYSIFDNHSDGAPPVFNWHVTKYGTNPAPTVHMIRGLNF